MIKFEVIVLLKTCCYTVDMSTPATEVIDFIQQFVEQQEGYQGACFSLAGEKGYYSVGFRSKTSLCRRLIIDLDDKTVQMESQRDIISKLWLPCSNMYCIGV